MNDVIITACLFVSAIALSVAAGYVLAHAIAYAVDRIADVIGD